MRYKECLAGLSSFLIPFIRTQINTVRETLNEGAPSVHKHSLNLTKHTCEKVWVTFRANLWGRDTNLFLCKQATGYYIHFTVSKLSFGKWQWPDRTGSLYPHKLTQNSTLILWETTWIHTKDDIIITLSIRSCWSWWLEGVKRALFLPPIICLNYVHISNNKNTLHIWSPV